MVESSDIASRGAATPTQAMTPDVVEGRYHVHAGHM
jgi:hypothetical protein